MVGDMVEVNLVLCSIETDKASADVPGTDAGTVLKLLWSEGDDAGQGAHRRPRRAG